FDRARVVAQGVPGEALRVLREGLSQAAGEQGDTASGCAGEVQPRKGLVASYRTVAAKSVGFEARGVGAPGEAVALAVCADARARGTPAAGGEAAAERGRAVAGGGE